MKPTPKGQTRADQIRELAEHQAGQFLLHELYQLVGAKTLKEKARVWNSVMDLIRNRGEAKRIGSKGIGLYEIKEKPGPHPNRQAVLRETMWRAIRANRLFTIDDLVVQSDAKREYAREYVLSLMHQGYLRRAGWRKESPRPLALYKLVKDQLAAPPNTGKGLKGLPGAAA
jgi:hypothetical protein